MIAGVEGVRGMGCGFDEAGCEISNTNYREGRSTCGKTPMAGAYGSLRRARGRRRVGPPWSACLPRAALAVAVLAMCTVPSARGAHEPESDDEGDPEQMSGDVQCPCVCDRRLDERFGSYWFENFGAGPIQGDVTCGTACFDVSDAADMLSWCAPHVNYRFCGLRMNDTTPPRTQARTAADDAAYLAMLDAQVTQCHEGTAFYGHGDDCEAIVIRNACYMAFPRCGTDDVPVGICQSSCVNELMECRQLNTDFGPREFIEDLCSGFGFEADTTGPDVSCTGGAGVISPSAAVLAVVWCLAAAATSVFGDT